MSAIQTKHAVVLGGSIAGLLAANVLARHFGRVTLVERDVFPEPNEPRKGVPQSRQLHGLLAGGRRVLESMFPEFPAGISARGAVDVDVGLCGDFLLGGRPMPRFESGLRCFMMSRPLLETYVRELALARDNIETLERCVVEGLAGDRANVRGVLIRNADAQEVQTLDADLVIDATGRGSRLPQWLESLGVAPPAEERVIVNMHGTSFTIRRKPAHLAGNLFWIDNPHPPSHRTGAALAIEGDRFVVGLTGYLDEPMPKDYEGALEFTRGLRGPGLYELLRDSEAVSEFSTVRFAASQRRRYERLRSFPRGLLVCGDALCSFNPLYGQGMTVAALEGEALDACLRAGTERLFERFSRAAAKLVDVPWSIVVGGDYAFEGVAGERTLPVRARNAFMNRLMQVAVEDEVVCGVFIAVMQMCAPPTALFAPGILRRVFFPRRSKRVVTVPQPVSEPAE